MHQVGWPASTAVDDEKAQLGRARIPAWCSDKIFGTEQAAKQRRMFVFLQDDAIHTHDTVCQICMARQPNQLEQLVHAAEFRRCCKTDLLSLQGEPMPVQNSSSSRGSGSLHFDKTMDGWMIRCNIWSCWNCCFFFTSMIMKDQQVCAIVIVWLCIPSIKIEHVVLDWLPPAPLCFDYNVSSWLLENVFNHTLLSFMASLAMR